MRWRRANHSHSTWSMENARGQGIAWELSADISTLKGQTYSNTRSPLLRRSSLPRSLLAISPASVHIWTYETSSTFCRAKSAVRGWEPTQAQASKLRTSYLPVRAVSRSIRLFTSFPHPFGNVLKKHFCCGCHVELEPSQEKILCVAVCCLKSGLWCDTCNVLPKIASIFVCIRFSYMDR